MKYIKGMVALLFVYAFFMNLIEYGNEHFKGAKERYHFNKNLAILSNHLKELNNREQIIQNSKHMSFDRITSRYGWRSDPWTGKQTFHHGTDFGAPEGALIPAPAAGIVQRAKKSSRGCGYQVTIRHPGKGFTRYCHLSKILVSEGQNIKKGQVIGAVGSTGRSTGPHLHLEVLNRRGKSQKIDFLEELQGDHDHDHDHEHMGGN